jgi:hypothetical protein
LHRKQITALCDVDTRTFDQAVDKRRELSVRDFGNGALGDWSCHLMNGFYKILDPDYPSSVECLENREATGRTFASGYKLRYEYPAARERPGFISY